MHVIPCPHPKITFSKNCQLDNNFIATVKELDLMDQSDFEKWY